MGWSGQIAAPSQLKWHTGVCNNDQPGRRFFGLGAGEEVCEGFAKVAAGDRPCRYLERGSAAARGRFGHFAAGNMPYRALERGYPAATLAERRYKSLAERS